MRVFVSALAALSLAGVAAPAMAQTQDSTIVVPADLTAKELRELAKLEKKRVKALEEIADSEKDTIEARSRIAKAEARLVEAEGRLREAGIKREKAERELARDQEKLAEIDARLQELRGTAPVELSRR